MNILQEEKAQVFRNFTKHYEPTEEWSETYNMWLPIEVKKRVEGRLYKRFEY